MSRNKITIDFFTSMIKALHPRQLYLNMIPHLCKILKKPQCWLLMLWQILKKICTENKAALGVKCNMLPEFQPYLQKAIDKVRTEDWNVTVRKIPGVTK